MRIAISGASGYVGSYLARYLLQDTSNTLLSIGRTVPQHASLSKQLTHIHLDTDASEADFAEILSFRPQCICHLAAFSLPNRCQQEPELAQSSNVTLTTLVTNLACQANAFLCSASTEWVFDGACPPAQGFPESAQPKPISVYARTKFEAEQVVRGLWPERSAIVRPSLIYGPPTINRKNFLSAVEETCRQGQEISLFRDEWRTAVFIDDVVLGLATILKNRITGNFHLAGPEKVSRVAFGQRLINFLGLSESLIKVINRADIEGMAFRAEDVGLNAEQTQKKLNLKFRTLEEGFDAVWPTK